MERSFIGEDVIEGQKNPSGDKAPKVVVWDTEVSPAIVAGYGNKWDFRYVKEIEPQKLMCYAYKYLGEESVKFVSMHDFESQVELVKSLADLLNEVDISIAHNGINFDDKMANTFFITNGVDRPSPRKSIDTLRVARRQFRFPSNGLDDLGEYLGLGGKAETTYGSIWEDFISGDAEAGRLMQVYNERDVELLEQIYLKFLPYIDNHPNMGVYMQKPGVCAHCGRDDALIRRGEAERVNGPVVQWYCKPKRGGCGTWSYERYVQKENSIPKEERSSLVSGK